MIKKVSERQVSVKLKGMVLTSSYMPVWRRGREREVEGEWETLGSHVRWAKKGELVVVGGDFNAHVGGVEPRRECAEVLV